MYYLVLPLNNLFRLFCIQLSRSTPSDGNPCGRDNLIGDDLISDKQVAKFGKLITSAGNCSQLNQIFPFQFPSNNFQSFQQH